MIKTSGTFKKVISIVLITKALLSLVWVMWSDGINGMHRFILTCVRGRC